MYTASIHTFGVHRVSCLQCIVIASSGVVLPASMATMIEVGNARFDARNGVGTHTHMHEIRTTNNYVPDPFSGDCFAQTYTCIRNRSLVSHIRLLIRVTLCTAT